MSSALVNSVADRISPDAATFASLPLPLACRVFLALNDEAGDNDDDQEYVTADEAVLP